jgi:2-amino-4-hydroxy-6-hydroxymethyldihydropteridine diphosphokinase
MLKTTYLSLGSNIGNREAELQSAINRLHSHDFQITRISSVYETEPIEYLDQPRFLNVVVEAQTTIFPMRLLVRIGNLEKQMGRKRGISKGPRNIDIDIVLFGKFIVDTPQLQIPHPRFAERRFVLEPLVELAPDLRHPVTRQTMKELLAAAPNQFVRKLPVHLDLPVGGEERP